MGVYGSTVDVNPIVWLMDPVSIIGFPHAFIKDFDNNRVHEEAAMCLVPFSWGIQ